MENFYGYIYKITNLINGMIYIGQCSYHPDSRLGIKYFGSGTKLKASVKENGKQNFKKEVLCICTTQNALNICETYLTIKFDAINPEVGYNYFAGPPNCSKIGSSMKRPEVSVKVKNFLLSDKNKWRGGKHTLETKKKISEAQLGENNHMFGKEVSEETKKKHSLNNSGNKNYFHKNNGYDGAGEKHPLYNKPVKQETLEKRSQSMKKWFLTNENPNKGKSMPEDQKQELRLKRLGTTLPESVKEMFRDGRRKGVNNPAFGSRYKWCNDGIKNKRLKLHEQLPEGFVFGFKN